MDLKAIYEFEWEDGLTRRTDDIENKRVAGESAIELLAQLGREDPECEVTLVGYEG